MTIYELKPKFQSLLRPLVNQLARLGVTANQVTMLALGASVAMGLFLSLSGRPSSFLLLPVFFFLRMAFNAIDGMLAREHGMKTPLGAILNELSDVIADSFLYFPFLQITEGAMIPGIIFLISSTITEMAGVIAVQIGASRRYDGPFGKSDRAGAFGLLALLWGVGFDIKPYMPVLFFLFAILCGLTILNRSRRALAEVPERK